MEGSNPTPYFFVREIFFNIIIALRRLFIIFLLSFNVFTIAIFFTIQKNPVQVIKLPRTT